MSCRQANSVTYQIPAIWLCSVPRSRAQGIVHQAPTASSAGFPALAAAYPSASVSPVFPLPNLTAEVGSGKNAMSPL